ncbi:UNVERIFIED_CONTAM: Leucine-rich repeat-containing protein 51 [Siphonaria sp. JEL0065]|nr:Leucine-rich repeat-containing protein 51 [Siphonaria sp. JEL0065]
MKEPAHNDLTAQYKKHAVSKLSGQWQVVPKTPLDFSFKEINAVGDIATEESRRRHELPLGTGVTAVTTAIRLPNNKIESLDNLFSISMRIVENPLNIAWIDLSFNNLKVIDKELLQFPTLSTLYLHANEISALPEIDKLTALTRLRTLTLHGNPVENCKGYRQYTVSRLSSLKHLDFCAITKQDKAIAKAYLDFIQRKGEKSGDNE